MNPVLSWGIVIVTVGVGYIAVKGVPASLRDGISSFQGNGQHDMRSKKDRRKRTRAPNKKEGGDESTGNQSLSDSGHATNGDSSRKVNTKARRPTKDMNVPFVSPRAGVQAVHEKTANGAATKVASWYKKDGASQINDESDDPVKNVMNGPRKTSTPIGRQQTSQAPEPQSSSVATSVSSLARDSDNEISSTHAAESHWLQQRRSHATDDMLEADTSYVARTLKIVPSTTTGTTKQSISQKKKEETGELTKKQRQNQAKKLKAKAEKAAAEQHQAAALQAHMKGLERQRIAEITRSEKLKPSTGSGTSSAWSNDEWKTVSKSKNKAAGQNTAHSGADELIWQ